MLPFVGVDGEGGDVMVDGFRSHHYTMLRVGQDFITGDPALSGDRCLRFLADLPKKQIHVAYFFDYDVTMMLRHLPEHALRHLVTAGETRWLDMQINYRPRKELRIKRRGRITTINDVGTFFQSAFLTALKRWSIGSPDVWDTIGAGKEQRSSFGELTPETVYYNQLECQLLIELMDKFRRTCQIIGYIPTRWQGPGQLAKAMFKKHGIPLTKNIPEFNLAGVWEMAQAAYYGGRFETSAVGPIAGPVDAWDINSAYPWAATQLPCLLHGHWRPTRNITPNGLYKLTFDHRPKSALWFSLPIRTQSGSIIFPRAGSGWYHGVELLSAQRMGATLQIHQGIEWVQDCDHKPFDFMHRLYSIRRGLGKSEAGMALKYGMNSAYGVCAQSIGTAPYANPIYAGLFTAHTRARLIDAISQDRHAVYMLATDGLFCRGGSIDLPETEELGGWERTTYPDGIHVVQPGVYFTGHTSTCDRADDCSCKPKTRGVPQTAILREESALKGAWHGNRDDHHSIDLRQFIGLRLGVARDALGNLGQWLPVTKEIGYDWTTKRRPAGTYVDTVASALRTRPYDDGGWTRPYERNIGGNLARGMDRLEFADTPDWAETLTEVL